MLGLEPGSWKSEPNTQTWPVLHRGVFCQFPFRWIYYYGSNKSTRKETGKTPLCALQTLKKLGENFRKLWPSLYTVRAPS